VGQAVCQSGVLLGSGEQLLQLFYWLELPQPCEMLFREPFHLLLVVMLEFQLLRFPELAPMLVYLLVVLAAR